MLLDETDMGETYTKANETLWHKFLASFKGIDFAKEKKNYESFKSDIALPTIAPFVSGENIVVNKNILVELSERATWLTSAQRELVVKEVLNEHKNGLSDKECFTLLGLLCAIAWSELAQDKRGSFNNYLYERVMKFKEEIVKTGLQSSMSVWQLPYPHVDALIAQDYEQEMKTKFSDLAEKEQFEERKKRYTTFTDDNIAVKWAVRVLKRIGLNRDPRHIFTLYNRRNQQCHINSVLQISLNFMRLYAEIILKKRKGIMDEEMDEEKFRDLILDSMTSKNNRSPQGLFEAGMKKEDINKLAKQLSQIEHHEDKEVDKLESILKDWPECDIDGGLSNPHRDVSKRGKDQVRRAIKQALLFFKLEMDIEINDANASTLLNKGLMMLGVPEGITAIPTHQGGDSHATRDEIVEKIRAHINDEEELREKIIEIAKEYGKNVERNPEGFFRHAMFQNQGDTYQYVFDGLEAFRNVLGNIMEKL